MGWPTTADYTEAVQDPGSSVGDEELQHGEVVCTPLGLPMLWSGNFAAVFKIRCPSTGHTWALKCFTCEVPGLRDRYRAVAQHLEQASLPFMVDFQYLEQGVRCGGFWYPALKMRWIEGLTLNQFVEEQLERPDNLRELFDLWIKLACRLREAQVAHADLQHGNVILVPKPGGQLALRLIDYDGMLVPSLAGTRSHEMGHPAYQHPQRRREGTYCLEVDRFSHLSICCALRCLMADGPALWRQFHDGDNLLLSEADYSDPEHSATFRSLWSLPDRSAHSLVGRLVLACRKPLQAVPLLEEVIADGHSIPLTAAEEEAVEAILSTPDPGQVGSAVPETRRSSERQPNNDAVSRLAEPAYDAGTASLLGGDGEPAAAVATSVQRATKGPNQTGVLIGLSTAAGFVMLLSVLMIVSGLRSQKPGNDQPTQAAKIPPRTKTSPSPSLAAKTTSRTKGAVPPAPPGPEPKPPTDAAANVARAAGAGLEKDVPRSVDDPFAEELAPLQRIPQLSDESSASQPTVQPQVQPPRFEVRNGRSHTFSVSAQDLVNKGQPTLENLEIVKGGETSGSHLASINDGDIYGDLRENSSSPTFTPADGTQIVFTLRTTTARSGYDIIRGSNRT